MRVTVQREDRGLTREVRPDFDTADIQRIQIYPDIELRRAGLRLRLGRLSRI